MKSNIVFLIIFTSVLIHTSCWCQLPKRKLFLLYDKEQNGKVEQQLLIFKKDSIGFAERDVTIEVVTPISDRKKYVSLSKQGKGFHIILIGKDGGEKFRSNEVTSAATLFALIDAMPMRKHEMNKTDY